MSREKCETLEKTQLLVLIRFCKKRERHRERETRNVEGTDVFVITVIFRMRIVYANKYASLRDETFLK